MKREEQQNLTVTIAEPQAASRGERRELFEELLKRTHQQAFHLALRLTGSRADAEDLVQESFIRAYRFFHRYDASLPFSSWLYRIMTNAHIDEVRRRSKIKATSFDEPHPETGSTWDFPDAAPSAEASLMNDQVEAEVQSGLDRMTPDFRIAVLLADMEGLSYEEIAEVMNTSIGTVRSRIHRGRKQLKNYLLKARPDRYGHLSEL